jgi:hypothetical protein
MDIRGPEMVPDNGKHAVPEMSRGQAVIDIEARPQALHGDLPDANPEPRGYDPYDNPGPLSVPSEE